MISERIKTLAKLAAERGKNSKTAHFNKDYNYAAINLYADLPLWEKLARSMAYALVNQTVWAYDGDGIGGRVYYDREEPVIERCPDLDYGSEARELIKEKYPYIGDLYADYIITGTSYGHVSWHFDRILREGTEGMKASYRKLLSETDDEKSREFYQGVIILLEALEAYSDKHADAYEALGNHALAERMRRVPRYPCRSFEDAVQAFFTQHIVVMRENPHGGDSPGRLDYYLWPYLERDLNAGKCTLEHAKELVDELFLRIDERLYNKDGWGETLSLGGTHTSGASAVNPLTYIMVESMIDLNITHPLTYVRVPQNPPKELISLCARYLMNGGNRAQILFDGSIINALMHSGVPYGDAVQYACGGCMEVSVQGATSDLLYAGWQNVPKMLELMITGGVCLLTGKKNRGFFADKGLVSYSDFESFYRDFIAEAKRLTHLFLKTQDIYSENLAKNRPSYLISSMIDNCAERGRNMHDGGAKYHDYGGSQVGLGGVADGLYAIKRAVFEEKICTAEELVSALKADFVGYERLQAKLQAIPKYGVDNPEVDAFVARVMGDFADMYSSFTTRWGGKGKAIILTFTYSPRVAERTGATPDGRRAHSSVSHGVTPASSSMKEGITAAINSCCRMPWEKFSGAASSMWDFDSSWINEELIEAILLSFMEQGGQIFQGNTTSVDELIEAKAHPESFENLIVRVGGYSARFVNLRADLQDEIIQRYRHGK